jgi:hypothetical protein
MAIHCEFIDIIIPIANIDKVYPGGFAAYKTDHKDEFNGRMYHDEYLFRDGAMSPQVAQSIVEEWESRGIIPITLIDGTEHWNELCSINILTGLTRPCIWALYDRKQNCVHMTGKPITSIVSKKVS